MHRYPLASIQKVFISSSRIFSKYKLKTRQIFLSILAHKSRRFRPTSFRFPFSNPAVPTRVARRRQKTRRSFVTPDSEFDHEAHGLAMVICRPQAIRAPPHLLHESLSLPGGPRFPAISHPCKAIALRWSILEDNAMVAVAGANLPNLKLAQFLPLAESASMRANDADSCAHHRGNDCLHRGSDTGPNKGSAHGENQKKYAHYRKKINHPFQIFSLRVSRC
jgi:hypothetical protein